MRMRSVAAVALAALLVGCGSTVASGPKAAASASPKSSPAVNPAVAWLALIGQDSTTMGNTMGKMGTSCSDVTQACIDATQATLDTVNGLKKDLDTHPAPDCLKDPATKLRDGVTLLTAGLAKALEGERNQDAATINAATSDISSGNDLVTQADKAALASHC